MSVPPPSGSDREGDPPRRPGTRLLVVVLVVQLVLAGVLLWAAATGFSFFRGLFAVVGGV